MMPTMIILLMKRLGINFSSMVSAGPDIITPTIAAVPEAVVVNLNFFECVNTL